MRVAAAPRAAIAIAAVCLLVACGHSRPTRDTVVQPLSTALRSHTRDFNLQNPDGCFALAAPLDSRVDVLSSADDKVNPSGLDKSVMHMLVAERDLGLIRIEYTQTPISSRDATVPANCVNDVRSLPSVFFSEPILHSLTVVQWRAALTEAALALHLKPNASFAVAEQHLVGVTGVIEQDPTTSLVDYNWQWVPTPAGNAFRLAESGSGTGRAVFRKYDDGWRVERAIP